MLTVTFTSNGDRVVIPVISGVTSAASSFAFLIRSPNGKLFKTGIKPLNGPADAFGEKPVHHVNVRGHVVSLADTSAFNKTYTSYSTVTDGMGKPATTKVVRVLQSKIDANAYFSALIDLNELGVRRFVEPLVYYDGGIYTTPRYTTSQRAVFIDVISPTRVTLIVMSSLWNAETELLIRNPSISYRHLEFSNDYLSYRYVAKAATRVALEPTFGRWEQPTTEFTVLSEARRQVLHGDSVPNMTRFSSKNLLARAELVKANIIIPRPLEWGDLAMTAAGNTRYLEINLSKYFVDLLTIRDILKPFLGLSMFRTMSWKALAQLVSSSSLMYRYGISLTVADTQDLLEAIERVRSTHSSLDYDVLIARSRGVENASCKLNTQPVPVVSTKSFKMRYTPIDNQAIEFFRQAWAWDLGPKFSTVWDYIPFSFCLGWISPEINHTIDVYDHRTYMAMLETYGCVMGSRIELPSIGPETFFGADGIYLYGSVELVFYERRISATIPSPISRPPGIDLPRLGSHFLEGLLLITQKRTS